MSSASNDARLPEERIGYPVDPGFTRRYVFAHFGKSLFWHCSELLFAFFLTEMCGMAPDRVGLLLALSLVVNALGDRLIGSMLSHRISDIASASRFQLFGSWGTAICFQIFAATGLLPDDWRLAAGLIGLFGFNLVYPFYDVPQNAILALAASTDSERARLSALRYMASGVANLLVSGAFIIMLKGYSGRAGAWHFWWIASLVCLAAIVSASSLGYRARMNLGVHAACRRPEVPSIAAASAPVSVLPLMLAMLTISFGTTIFARLEPYLAAFVLGSRISAGGFMLSVALSNLVSQAGWAWVAARTNLRQAFTLASAALIAGVLLIGLLATLGAGGAIVGGAIYGFGAGGVLQILWAWLARQCSVHPRDTARLFGRFTFYSKMGLASAALGIGLAMARFDYHHMSVHLTWLMIGVSATSAVLCWALLRGVSRKTAP